jgi:TrmH family RNA methyltransferase
MKFIESNSNPKLREINGLMTKSGLRKKSDVFVVEGQRELDRAIRSGFVVKELYWCPDVWDASHFESWMEKTSMKSPVIGLSKKAYNKISYRSHSEGIIGLLHKKSFSLDSLPPTGDNPLILVVEHLEKPGNLGAILRTADAAQVSCVLVAEPKTDLYNPNIIRSSVGGFFSVPIGVGSNDEVYEYLSKKNINVYAACLQGATDYLKEDFSSPTAIVMGAEDTGLGMFWRERSNKIIKIPMGGIVDSMNVSVASAILIYEVLRQRNFNH